VGDLILLRHGETEWSRIGRHTGRTDIPLTAAGEAAAAALAPLLAKRQIVAVLTSPARRATRTAELALGGAAAGAERDPDLWEWDYGGYEGMTTDQIQASRPGWYLWRHPRRYRPSRRNRTIRRRAGRPGAGAGAPAAPRR